MAFSNASRVSIDRGVTPASIELHNSHTGELRQLAAPAVDGGNGAVPGQRQAQGFGHAVHAVRREQAGAGAAGGRRAIDDLEEVAGGHLALLQLWAELRNLAHVDALVHRTVRAASGRR